MADDVTSWRELREFKAVDLAASYALSWRVEDAALQVDVDLCLTPEHAFYEPPRPSERACIRPAVLEFPQCRALAAGGRRAVADDRAERAGRADIAALAAAIGHGRITDLERRADGSYRLDGEFGRVEIRAGRPLLRLRPASA